MLSSLFFLKSSSDLGQEQQTVLFCPAGSELVGSRLPMMSASPVENLMGIFSSVKRRQRKHSDMRNNYTKDSFLKILRLHSDG